MKRPEVGIIGAGQAGVNTAQRLAAADIDVTLYSDEQPLPYYRPRVVALAFSLLDADAPVIHPLNWYKDQGIDLLRGEGVVAVNSAEKEVVSQADRKKFDSIVISAGAKPFIPPFARNKQKVVPMWDYERSLSLQQYLPCVRRLAIVGGGITGVETSVYAREKGIETVLIERLDHLMPLQLGKRAGGVLEQVLRNKGVDIKTSASVQDISEDGEEECLRIAMENGETIDCDLVITAIGGYPDLTPYRDSDIRLDKGIVVDNALQTSVPGIFAAGDIAQQDDFTAANLLVAARHGRSAGDNVLSYLQGENLNRHSPEPLALSFKHGDFQVHAAGSSPCEREEEQILEDSDGAFRALRMQNGILQGVEMIGTRKEFRELCKAIGTCLA